jgi:hypothetical protein
MVYCLTFLFFSVESSFLSFFNHNCRSACRCFVVYVFLRYSMLSKKGILKKFKGCLFVANHILYLRSSSLASYFTYLYSLSLFLLFFFTFAYYIKCVFESSSLRILHVSTLFFSVAIHDDLAFLSIRGVSEHDILNILIIDIRVVIDVRLYIFLLPYLIPIPPI